MTLPTTLLLEFVVLWKIESKIKPFEDEMAWGDLLFHSPLFTRGLQGK